MTSAVKGVVKGAVKGSMKGKLQKAEEHLTSGDLGRPLEERRLLLEARLENVQNLLRWYLNIARGLEAAVAETERLMRMDLVGQVRAQAKLEAEQRALADELIARRLA